MKKIPLLIIMALLLLNTSCFTDRDDSAEVLSEWKLIEVRLSTGGDAEFVPAEVDETIAFLTDSKISRSTGWCLESEETVTDYNLDGEIILNCEVSGVLNYIIEGDIMIISSPMCIEVCEYKYQRI